MRYISTAIIFILFAWGCQPRGNRKAEKPVVLVSILPQKTFIEKIAGDDFIVTVLIPHGANPTTYSLLPAQMAEISVADAWFRMGYIGFELSWIDKIRETNRAMKVIDLSSGLDLIGKKPDSKSSLHTGIDPHTWLSPCNVKKMALQIRDELTRINPGKAEAYALGYRQFSDEITRTDEEIQSLLKDLKGRKFITFHPSLSYFARDYGLIQLSLEEGGKEPTPLQMAGLAATAKSEGIRSVFIQSDFDKELARIFAEEIRGKIIQVWPLNPDWSENMLEMTKLLIENL